MTLLDIAAPPVRMPRCRMCLECGLPTPSPRSAFCCQQHRRDFNNRRAMRGSELYDLVMEWRFDRKGGGKAAFTQLCTIAGRFNDEDRARGRRSWSPSRRMSNINSRRGR